MTIPEEAEVFIHALEVNERGLYAYLLKYVFLRQSETGTVGHGVAVVMAVSMSESQAC